MDSKYIQYIHPSSPSPYAPLHWYPPSEKTSFIFLSFISFLSVTDSSRGFHLDISDMYISCFNQTNPPLLTLPLLPCSPIIQQLSVHCAMLSLYTDALFQHFYSLTFPFLLPPQTDPLIQSCSLYISTYISTYVCVYIYIFMHTLIL
jgi:hypothetical protein